MQSRRKCVLFPKMDVSALIEVGGEFIATANRSLTLFKAWRQWPYDCYYLLFYHTTTSADVVFFPLLFSIMLNHKIGQKSTHAKRTHVQQMGWHNVTAYCIQRFMTIVVVFLTYNRPIVCRWFYCWRLIEWPFLCMCK